MALADGQGDSLNEYQGGSVRLQLGLDVVDGRQPFKFSPASLEEV